MRIGLPRTRSTSTLLTLSGWRSSSVTLERTRYRSLARSRRPIWASKSNFSMTSRVSAAKAAIQARRLPTAWPGSARMARRFRREVL